MAHLKSVTKNLYEEDYALWIDKIVEQIKQQDLKNLDWEHLLEEIEDLGKELRNKVDSYTRQLLIHLLLYRYWTIEKEYCARGWRGEIANFRYELETLFKSRTLYNYFLENLHLIYPKARKQTLIKTELSSDSLPLECPFTPSEILDQDFFPDSL